MEYFPQYMYESAIRTATNNPDLNVNLNVVSYPLFHIYEKRIAQGQNIDYCFIVSIAIALIPTVIVSFILKEREN